MSKRVAQIAFVLAALSLLLANPGHGQYNRKPSNDPFLKSQWFLGFRLGTNLSKAVPETRYSSFSPVNYSVEQLNKDYDGFSKPGLQAGLEFAYYSKRWTVSIQPMFAIEKFGYQNSYQWQDQTNPSNSLQQEFQVKNEIQFLDFPLLLKYDLRTGDWRPFVQVGGYLDVLLSASKEITSSGTDAASGSPIPFEGEPINVGTDDLYQKTNAGILAGAGIAYRAGNVRFVFDVNYRFGLTNMVNEGARYSDGRLTSIGDVMDDFTIQSLWFTLGTQFPLKFISKNYDAVN